MEFCWITLPVRDMEKSLYFYHNVLGLPICSRHEGNGAEIVMLGEKKQPKVELICRPGAGEDHFVSSISVGLTVNTIAEAVNLLKQHNIAVEEEPVAPNPYLLFLFIKDPDGYTVQLVETKK